MTARRAVVVGNDGIARASALRLASDGFDVLLAGTEPQQTVEEITAQGRAARAVHVDLADPVLSSQAILDAIAGWAYLHALVNAHFHVEMTSFADLTPGAWQRSMDVNVTGPLLVTQRLRAQLAAAAGSAVVHLGSIDGFFGNPSVLAYSAAKAALVPITHVMAHELAADDIRVNCVARALVVDADNPPAEPLLAATPLGRAARADEIAAVVAFLVSEQSSYLTGAVIPVDGGRTGITRGTS
jgi:NAD(P)-dependent dehydrogenase (short-subunit alcohol dehydrogenase family)